MRIRVSFLLETVVEFERQKKAKNKQRNKRAGLPYFNPIVGALIFGNALSVFIGRNSTLPIKVWVLRG